MNFYVATAWELYAAYIGEKPIPPAPFTPWADTLLYLPLTEDTNDHSWNWYNPTATNVSITTVGSISCWYFNAWKLQFSQFATMSSIDFTVLVWVKFNSQWQPHSFISTWSAGADKLLNFRTNNNTTWFNFWWYWDDLSVSQTLSTSSWQLVTATYNHSTKYWVIYYNWSSIWTKTYSNPNVTANPIYVWVNAEVPNNSNYMFRWYMSQYILENKVWTDTEILDYYNATKENY